MAIKELPDGSFALVTIPLDNASTCEYSQFDRNTEVLSKARLLQGGCEVVAWAEDGSFVEDVAAPEGGVTQILSDLTARDSEVLVKVLGTWDSSVFDVPTVTRIVETELKTAQNKKYLKEALLVLDYKSVPLRVRPKLSLGRVFQK
ncbi:hypothetical protein NDN08_000125 [Rhodosorus marinus]|uniref:Uncharacterized protein n=1 Tax=Rhodosorus marinus TaxID=101924 RepID=A0AAV8UH78_9RHOD|nr:hypothetical protein NDN08_000125 [Rhodosorus marinus]